MTLHNQAKISMAMICVNASTIISIPLCVVSAITSQPFYVLNGVASMLTIVGLVLYCAGRFVTRRRRKKNDRH